MEMGSILERLNTALGQLYENESRLIQNHANEETIATHFAGYLKSLFIQNGWNVDACYNRDGADPKKDSRDNLILPDIIVHHQSSGIPRFSPENNLVAIEIKGHWNRDDRNIDVERLKNLKERYGYQYVFQIELNEESGEIIAVR